MKSPLRKATADSVPVCGKILKAGQSVTVAATAIGPRELKAQEKGRITIRPSNEKGKVQILCILGE